MGVWRARLGHGYRNSSVCPDRSRRCADGLAWFRRTHAKGARLAPRPLDFSGLRSRDPASVEPFARLRVEGVLLALAELEMHRVAHRRRGAAVGADDDALVLTFEVRRAVDVSVRT